MNSSGIRFWGGATFFLAAALLMTQVIGNQYPFFACYVILQFIVLAVAWSILGGYAGYVNFGTSAFFGIGVYTAVFLFKATGAPLAAIQARPPGRYRVARPPPQPPKTTGKCTVERGDVEQ